MACAIVLLCCVCLLAVLSGHCCRRKITSRRPSLRKVVRDPVFLPEDAVFGCVPSRCDVAREATALTMVISSPRPRRGQGGRGGREWRQERERERERETSRLLSANHRLRLGHGEIALKLYVECAASRR